ncbi:TPR repeat-containing protein [Chondrus crispus]|uniref:TPR repeat-containing protein n=1 Tax=Chondrus crispus TaxID=2769 RepID=R7QSZ3_CHOCR|nr:TPR repeat-containing protein [Chondrus crispus]CDF41259.1 TPR repeat-containing protein [Chondrus crispus]|eukprot:XP_005711553.1 TPR repeat-containing protein [Chondrus crispus]
MEARCGRVDEAREIFRSGLVEDPNNVRLIHAWAVEEDRAGRPAHAAELFRQCLDIDPDDGIVWQSYALCEERAGNTPVARAVFQQGVEADPTNAYLWSAWGVLEQRHGRLELACDLFEKAVRLNPQHARTFQAWAITKEKMGLHAESEALFRRALDVSPRNAPTLQAYGLFEARRGNLDRARDLFETGIQADPNHAPIWHAWAVMEQREKNYDTARELFDNGVNAAPNSTPMLRAWASMELELGHIDKSRDWMVPPSSRNKWKRGTKQRAYAPGKRDRDKSNDKQISAVGKNLQMLRLMIERRSDEDVRSVMQWLSGRARADRRLADAISARRENDSRRVTEWIERRSTSDIKAFKEWLDDRYEKDSRIGVYIFNWDIPLSKSMSSTPVPVRVSERRGNPVEKPAEWLRLSEEPRMGLQAFDDQLFHRENPTDYGEGIYFMGQIAENLADRAALVLVLSAMTFGLIGVSGYLFDLGYSPSGQSTQTARNIEGAMSKPSGVDAILYEEGGAESVIQSKLGCKRP